MLNMTLLSIRIEVTVMPQLSVSVRVCSDVLQRLDDKEIEATKTLQTYLLDKTHNRIASRIPD